MEKIITIDSVLSMTQATDSFLVDLEDNVYGIRFVGFKIRDCDTGEVFHDFKAQNIYELDYFADNELEYVFPHKILKSKTIGTNLTFVVGDKPVKNLDFVERHYIGDELAKSYEFKFPLFMPSSENNIEFIYPVPNLNDEAQNALINGDDISAKSDTFIFVDNKLVIHRRANYIYSSKDC